MLSNVVVKSTVWLERSGTYLVGEREARLLDAVERAGSIKEAAKAVDLSYRTAWARIQALEHALGHELVRSRAGGAGGGATSLTAEGRDLVDRLLDSQSTPEEVCASCPELLPEVRRRWKQLRRLQGELDVLFPASSEGGMSQPARMPVWRMPSAPKKRVITNGWSCQSHWCGCCGLMRPNSVNI